MKRLLVFFFLMVMLSMPANAEIACDCVAQSCECFIQLGDKGIAVKAIVQLLVDQGYLDSNKENTFDQDVYEAVLAFQAVHGLEESGVMDDETLTTLIWGLDGPKVSDEEDEMEVVFVPTDGGIKYHGSSDCSGMYDPRKMTVFNAIALGVEKCKRAGCWEKRVQEDGQ